MNNTKSAELHVNTFPSGLPSTGSTPSGPKYNIGSHKIRHILRQVISKYPNLERIQNGSGFNSVKSGKGHWKNDTNVRVR